VTITELHADEALRRLEFPVCAGKIFLGHAAVAPLPRCVAKAVADFADSCTRNDQEAVLAPGWVRETRASVAELIRAKPEEIAFVGPTSLALSQVAAGLPFRRGDNVLVYFDDYPSNVYPWMALAERGVKVRFLNVKEPGRIRMLEIEGQVDESTRLVALASCHFLSGWRIDLESIGRFLRSRNILFCLDAIQTLGAFPTTVEHVDFLAADAHKWLLGPCGAGILYVRQDLQERLRPIAYGWHNVRSPNFVAQEAMNLRPDARRYEPGTANLLGLVGLRAGVELVKSVGIANIAADLARKRSWLVPAIQAKGYTVLHPTLAPENTSGILAFFRAGAEMAALHAKLLGAGIVSSLRVDRKGQQSVRLSPHFYNTDAELQRVIDVI
jgi:selenocysteine lyase/cysteine desulfurase